MNLVFGSVNKMRKDDEFVDLIMEYDLEYQHIFWELFHYVDIKNPRLLDKFIKMKQRGY